MPLIGGAQRLRQMASRSHRRLAGPNWDLRRQPMARAAAKGQRFEWPTNARKLAAFWRLSLRGLAADYPMATRRRKRTSRLRHQKDLQMQAFKSGW